MTDETPDESTAPAPGGDGGTRELLLVEDLMLLLLDDDGASVRAAGTLYYTLGGALLVELALLGLIDADDQDNGLLNGPRVRPTGSPQPADPLLREAMATIAAKPQRVQPLLVALGADLWKVVLERLVDRGLIEREERKLLGIFRTTRWPAVDAEHEAALRARILDVLVDGGETDPRTAAVIGLLYASGAMPALSPPLPWTSDTVRRAQALQDGDWGAAAVRSAVDRTAAAIAASVAAATISTTIAAGR